MATMKVKRAWVAVVAVVLAAAVVSLVLSCQKYVVNITNESGATISALSLTGQGIGKDVLLGDLAPGTNLSYSFYTGSDGPLRFKARWNNMPVEGTIDGYLTGGISGEGMLVFRANGTFKANSRVDTSAYNHPMQPTVKSGG